MKITILTLYKDFLENLKTHSIIKNAISKKLLTLEIIDLHAFLSPNDNNQVDDYLYGGGKGMLIKFPLVYEAIKSVKKPFSKVILLTPQGNIWTQKKVSEFLRFDHLIFLCGHFEGIDARIKYLIDYSISLGEFITSGAETIVSVIIDSLTRSIPNVISPESLVNESFNDYNNGLMECDHYTRPIDAYELSVPKVLLSGNHHQIEMWRKNSAIDNTVEYLKKKYDDQKNNI